MLDLTLIIPAKFEKESLPVFLKEIKNFKCKKIVILEENDIQTINAIQSFQDIKIHYQVNKGYGSAIVEGVKITDTKFFCIINADGSMNPNYLEKTLHYEVSRKKIAPTQFDASSPRFHAFPLCLMWQGGGFL